MTGKLREPEARVLALRIARDNGGEVSTSKIKEDIPKYRELSPEDRLPSDKRPGEEMWQQIVGNATASHKDSSTSIFSNGFAEKTADGIKITPKGEGYLTSQGF